MKTNILTVAKNGLTAEAMNQLKEISTDQIKAIINKVDSYYIQIAEGEELTELDDIQTAFSYSDDLLYQSQLCIDYLLKLLKFQSKRYFDLYLETLTANEKKQLIENLSTKLG